MPKFRKKPVVIEAVLFNGQNTEEIERFLEPIGAGVYQNQVVIQTLEGVMKGDIGDWIIRGVKGEFYPCKPDIFAATYEHVEETLRKRPTIEELERILAGPNDSVIAINPDGSITTTKVKTSPDCVADEVGKATTQTLKSSY
jgi:hypothetical protein